MMWSVDVWHSTTFPVAAEPEDWRRYRVVADTATEAELIACQMTAAHTGWTPVRSVVVDWEEP